MENRNAGNNLGSVINNVNIGGGSSSPGITVSVVVPIISAILAAAAGAYANNKFTVTKAPEQVATGASTLAGLANETLELIKTKQMPEIEDRLRKIEQQAQAIEANANLLRDPSGTFSGQADFWLPLGGGVVLGKTTSFGFGIIDANGGIWSKVNGKEVYLSGGGRVDFEDREKRKCFLTFTGTSPDKKLFGFKTICGA